MTVRKMAENMAQSIDSMADEIAKRSVPSSDESFHEWSSHRLHERIKIHACNIILDYLLGDFQTLAALGATKSDEPRQSAPLPEPRKRGNRQRLRPDSPEMGPALRLHRETYLGRSRSMRMPY
jgi:hypothetical protein